MKSDAETDRSRDRGGCGRRDQARAARNRFPVPKPVQGEMGEILITGNGGPMS
jgi:hypothetical protein